jgi:hypothetical protein
LRCGRLPGSTLNGNGGTRKYYDHTADPFELNNLHAVLSTKRQTELATRLQVLRP